MFNFIKKFMSDKKETKVASKASEKKEEVKEVKEVEVKGVPKEYFDEFV